jgi:hypothetical protein
MGGAAAPDEPPSVQQQLKNQHSLKIARHSYSRLPVYHSYCHASMTV